MMDLFTSDPNTLFYLMMTVAVLAIGGVVVVLSQTFKRTASDVVSERIQGIGFQGRAKRRKVDDQLEKAMSSLSRLTAPNEQQKITGLRKALSYAGYRSSKAPMFFFGIKAAGALLLGGLGVVYSMANAENLLHILITVGAGTALGLYVPNLWLRVVTRRRNDALNKALPNTLDLLIVCVEAGLGLNMALKRVGEEIEPTAPKLAKELALVSLEMNTGIPYEKALTNLAERNSLDDLRSLATVLIQSDKLGTSIAQALRVSADTIRTRRHQAAEEKAAKMSVKLTLPLVLFILPATFMIVIGPGIITIIENLLPALTK
ncbi:MAG: type II secretion system F family protein [bacterium]|nr:type II secretion system F family protein [bacterium]